MGGNSSWGVFCLYAKLFFIGYFTMVETAPEQRGSLAADTLPAEKGTAGCGGCR